MSVTIAQPHPLTDYALARRLERTEATANAAYVESRARLEPDVGAGWRCWRHVCSLRMRTAHRSP